MEPSIDPDDSTTSLWEKMLISEMKKQATKRNQKVSDIEEESNLIQAMSESLNNEANSISEIHNNSISETLKPMTINASHPKSLNGTTLSIDNNSKKLEIEPEDTFDDATLSKLMLNSELDISSSMSVNNDDHEQEEDVCIWLKLPTEISHKIIIMLGDVDMCGYLNMIAKNNPFRPSEYVFRNICQNIFTNQTVNKKFQLDKWKTWKNMMIYRPRLRTNGFYCLRTSYTRAPNHDNFWEEKHHEFIEVKIFRHMRFFNNGYVLYCMDIIDPYDMAKHFAAGLPTYHRIYEGNLSLSFTTIIYL